MMKNNLKLLVLLLLTFVITSCQSTFDQIKRIGRQPDFSKLRIPDTSGTKHQNRERNVEYETRVAQTNSLWQPGSTTFFKDNRSWTVGDIVRVVVQIQDKANLDNSTNQSMKNDDRLSLSNLMGKENAVKQILSADNTAADLVKSGSDRKFGGSGSIKRQEDITTEIAAIVMQVLPNGNLVVQGHQEVRVNYELREVKVAGIVRPQDIRANNSVQLSQIAEARVSYGGRGTVSDIQKKPIVSEILDIVAPF